MKTTVKITAMNGKSGKINTFANEVQAREYFEEKCNELGYEINGDEAGGIGHDLRIELC